MIASSRKAVSILGRSQPATVCVCVCVCMCVCVCARAHGVCVRAHVHVRVFVRYLQKDGRDKIMKTHRA